MPVEYSLRCVIFDRLRISAALPYFSQLSLKRQDFLKKKSLFNRKFCSDFLINF